MKIAQFFQINNNIDAVCCLECLMNGLSEKGTVPVIRFTNCSGPNGGWSRENKPLTFCVKTAATHVIRRAGSKRSPGIFLTA